MKERLLYYAKYISLGLIIVVIGIKLRALFFLPDVELPIIAYKKIVSLPTSSNEISQSLFHAQISDLSVNGYEAISPKKLSRYKAWGIPFPEIPVMLLIETIDRETLNYAASILKDYNFSATVCIPADELIKLASSEDDSRLATKEELLAFEQAKIYNFGLKISTDSKVSAEAGKIMKEIFNHLPSVISIPKDIDSATNIPTKTKIHVSAKENFVNTINSKTDLQKLSTLGVIGNRLTFSIKAIRHPGAISVAEILIAQPIGERFKVAVSVFDKDFNRLLGKNFDELPVEPILLGDLPNKVDFPISIYITDETGVILYKQERFNRYTIERGDPVPTETIIPDELIKALSEIEIPLDVE